ncbi:MAG: hypothetical protein HOP31_12500 [Ignavibacteria bacterium]|nr:hypothetical protein [Ignavibacteria bacterium]
MKITIIITIIFSYLIGCNASEEENHKYEPEYNGKFVNTEEQLQGWYLIPVKYFHDNDPIRSSIISSRFFLAETDDEIIRNDTSFLKVEAFPDIKITVKQYAFRNTNNPESKYTSGIKVVLKNYSNDTLMFGGQDGSAKMIQEALHPNGKWQAVEYWQNSSCGNSFVMMYFPPGSKIELGAYKYSGTYKTKLRFKLFIFNEDSKNRKYSKKIVYSEPFEGSVNYSQFQIRKDFFINYFE